MPLALEGNHVRLVPLEMVHLDALYEAGNDERLWQVTTTVIRSREDMRDYIAEALEQQAARIALPFVIVVKSTGEVVGSTRFGNVAPVHKRVEIGWTWINPRWQRTYVNTETKYLLLRHAFETLGCIRVEFKTDSLNLQSRKALAGIGAVEEGTMRNHMIVPGGRKRHSVYFSIIDAEWPEVRKKLEARLARFGRPGE
ncbi:MAG TPA: GNAT family protein [Bacteroidota bacterium]|nr:GNAT family protein [Bacteroidota bacterium]